MRRRRLTYACGDGAAVRLHTDGRRGRRIFLAGCAAFAKQAIELALDDLIAFADASLETLAVNDLNVPTTVLNQPCSLQFARGQVDALPARTKHGSDELLSHHKLAGFDSVVTEQEPSAQALFGRVPAIARSGLGNLGNQRLRVAQQQELKLTA